MGRKKKEGNDEMEETVEETFEDETVEDEVTGTEDPRCKREIIYDTIMTGGATLDSLQEAAGCKYASVMSNFSQLRLQGRYPVKDVETPITDDEGNEATILTYRITDAEEWAQIKADRAENAKTKSAPAKTPEEQLELLKKRVEKATKTSEAANARLEKDEESVILGLRAQKADIELQIAQFDLTELETKMAD